MVPFLPKLRDEGRVGAGETVTELLELTSADVLVPSGLDAADPLLKLGGIVFSQVTLGVPLHMDNAELDVSLGKEAFHDAEESREVVLDDKEDPPETSFEEASEDGLPFLQAFPARSSHAAEDPALTIATQTDDHVDAARAKTVAVADLHVFPVHEDGDDVGIQRTGVSELDLFDEAGRD